MNGKAGPGKSTFMKYLRYDKRTSAALCKWAGRSELLLKSSTFGAEGPRCKNSQMGLYRSLLLKVLNQRRELIPVVFPSVCRSILSGEINGAVDLTQIELKDAFLTPVNAIRDDLSICFIIDGIGEYGGDHTEVCANKIAL